MLIWDNLVINSKSSDLGQMVSSLANLKSVQARKQ